MKKILGAISIFFCLMTTVHADSSKSGTLAAPLEGLQNSFVHERATQTSKEKSWWWKDPAQLHLAVSVPIFSLRRAQNDPGIGKFTDIVSYYRDHLKPVGVDTLLFLPHFYSIRQYIYSPMSSFAVNQAYIDLAAVPEISHDAHLCRLLVAPPEECRNVDYRAVEKRERQVATIAYRRFYEHEIQNNSVRAQTFARFVKKNAWWLDDFAECMALYDSCPEDLKEAVPGSGVNQLIWKRLKEKGHTSKSVQEEHAFEERVQWYKYMQWIGYQQLHEALSGVKALGGHPLFDMPMFRSKDSVDVFLHPEYFIGLNKGAAPGVVNQWVHEVWVELALYNWTALAKNNYAYLTKSYDHWLSFGFDGARADALHFAYNFGEGQLASGDEPGDAFVGALARIFRKHGALGIAEAFNGQHARIEHYGFVNIQTGDWKSISSHDTPRLFATKDDFRSAFYRQMALRGSGKTARFISFLLGDQWGDTEPVKRMEGLVAYFDYRIPDEHDPDYQARIRFNADSILSGWRIATFDDVWKHPELVQTMLDSAAGTFVKHTVVRGEKTVEIWASSRDWFQQQWGRDTFIALPGLLLSTGRFEEARAVLRSFARFEKDGLIPNRIWNAENSNDIHYNNVDGSLWFIRAIEQYVRYTHDWVFAEELLPTIQSITDHYVKGTAYLWQGWWHPIKMDDADSLLMGPPQGTWMDADPEATGWGVTPREGKAVEINALWFTAVRFRTLLEYHSGNREEARTWYMVMNRIRKSFMHRFWNREEQALFDVVDGDPHGAAIRPNMLFAIGFTEIDPFMLEGISGEMRNDFIQPLVSYVDQIRIVRKARRDLLTPYGLRTLSPRDSYYQAWYNTDDFGKKDWAYHQGTVWPWLIGVYCDSRAQTMKYRGASDAEIKAELRAILTPLVKFLLKSPYHSINEVFDGGDPKYPMLPQIPGGTSAQAWSVAEVLRIIESYHLLGSGKALLPDIRDQQNTLQAA